MPEISVIMPSFNHERYIESAIVSVLDQGYSDLELIIVDDCSNDSSRSIIENVARSDARVRCIFHDRNRGIAVTFNDGIDQAEGKYVAFLASDDLWAENKLERQLALLRLNEDLVVWSEGEIIDENGRAKGGYFTTRYKAVGMKKSGIILEDLLLGNFILPSSAILKRENAGRIRFDENLKYMNDFRFFVDLASRYQFAFVDQPLVKYRIHGRNTIFSDRRGWCRDSIDVGQYFLQKYGAHVSKKARARIIGRTAVAYSCLEERFTGLQLACKAISLSPFDSLSIFHLGMVLTNEDGILRGALRKLIVQS